MPLVVRSEEADKLASELVRLTEEAIADAVTRKLSSANPYLRNPALRESRMPPVTATI
jgi:hypothetical protein